MYIAPHDWYRLGLAAALNFFESLHRAGAEIERCSKSYIWTDGSRQDYEEFRVRLP